MGEATSGNLLWALATVAIGLLWAVRELVKFLTARKQSSDNGHSHSDNTLAALARVNVTPRDIANHYERQDEVINIMKEHTSILKQLAHNSSVQTRLMERMEARLDVHNSRI